MIQLEMIQKIWTLIPMPALDGSIEAREIDVPESKYGNPRFTVDSKYQRHLLIPAPDGIKLIVDKKSSGVQLHSNLWGDLTYRRNFVDLVCLKPHLNSLFDLIVYDIVSALSSSDETPDRICQQVINQWRELLSTSPSLPLDRQVLIGLLGELSVLFSVAKKNIKALVAWIGPDMGRYDFFAGGNAVEVKTTTQRNGTILTIHGVEQLVSPVNGNLHLVVIHLEETPGSGINIGGLINSLVDLGIDRASIYNKLVKLGVTPDIVASVSDQHFSISDQHVYMVDDQFPKVTKESFKNGLLPTRVINLSYQIDLSIPPPFPLIPEKYDAVFQDLASKII